MHVNGRYGYYRLLPYLAQRALGVAIQFDSRHDVAVKTFPTPSLAAMTETPSASRC